MCRIIILQGSVCSWLALLSVSYHPLPVVSICFHQSSMCLLFFVVIEEVSSDTHCIGVSWWDLNSDVVLACCVEELERLTRVLRALLLSLSLLERNDLPTAHDHSRRIVLITKGSFPCFFLRHNFFLQKRRLPYIMNRHFYQRDCPLSLVLAVHF